MRSYTPPSSHLVDELGTLQRELAPLKLKIDRLESLKKTIRDSYALADADASFTATGEKFVVALGPKAQQRFVDVRAAWKRLGAKTFGRIATVTLKSLEGVLATEELEQVVTSSASGPRALKVYEMATTE